MKFASPEICEKAARAYIDGKGTAKLAVEMFGYTRATGSKAQRRSKKLFLRRRTGSTQVHSYNIGRNKSTFLGQDINPTIEMGFLKIHKSII